MIAIHIFTLQFHRHPHELPFDIWAVAKLA